MVTRPDIQALRDQMAALNATRDAISIGWWGGGYSYMNASHRQMFGFTPDEDVSGMTWRDCFGPAMTPPQEAQIMHAVMTTGAWRGEMRARRRTGEVFDVEVSVSGVGEDGFVSIVHEISARKDVDVQRGRQRGLIEKAHRRDAIAQVVQKVRHDFGNVIAVVSGTAQLMETAVAGNEPLTQGVARIGLAMDAAMEILDDLSRFDRPKAVRSWCDLHSLITQGVDLIETYRLAQIEVEVHAPQTPQVICVDQRDFLQVFHHLMLNACEAATQDVTRVTVSHCGPHVAALRGQPHVGDGDDGVVRAWFEIKDTGHGIAPDVLARLRTPHVSTKAEKAGFGLSIVSAILRANRGVLFIESGEGEGTTITVGWPVDEGDAFTDMAAFDVIAQDRPLAGATILVVSDLPLVADLLMQMIDAAGGVAMASRSVDVACEMVRDEPDMWSGVVVDMQAPELSSVAIATAAASCVRPIPTVLLRDPAAELAGIAPMFAACVDKPITPDALTKAIAAALISRA
ncbi:ATP-binding protein [Celeribacter marinus]|uniref:ATP-binding protein n=1 Tax=Celeribacter marinus TaxID=1397108 RepID=UPI00317BC84C